MTVTPAYRILQRRILAGLSGLTVLGMAWPLVRPHQPPLPELPAQLRLPGGWSTAVPPAVPAPPARRYRPLGRPTALGPSLSMVRPDGQWLLLTPFASWTEGAFSMQAAREGMPALTDKPQQRCLSRQGSVGEDPLPALIGWNTQPLSAPLRLWHTLVPVSNRSYSCLLITTNASGVLDDSAAARALRAQLRASVSWPAPPGL